MKCQDKKCQELIECNNHIAHINNSLQMECMKKQYSDLINENNTNNLRYKQLLKEIDNMYLLLESNINKNCNNECNECNKCEDSCNNNSTCSNTAIFKYNSKIQTHIIGNCTNFIYITAVGAGGAGGVGLVKDMYYYSGGGGGAGACIIKKPIKVTPGTIINVYVGLGGFIKPDLSGENGENTTIEILYPNGTIKTLVLHGGNNGFPFNNVLQVNGGKGGIDDCGLTFLNGADGSDGCITIPSQIAACGGKGGKSMMCNGGKGGGNYFDNGGKGGTTNMLSGENGEFGSGGGGSIPRFIPNDIPSGLGGDGIVIIEW